MDFANVLGTLASIASVLSFTPQAWRIVRTRDTSSLSSRMYMLTVSGFALWVAYGIALGAWPIICCNAICLLLSSFILMMKLLPKPRMEAVANALDPTSRSPRGV